MAAYLARSYGEAILAFRPDADGRAQWRMPGLPQLIALLVRVLSTAYVRKTLRVLDNIGMRSVVETW